MWWPWLTARLSPGGGAILNNNTTPLTINLGPPSRSKKKPQIGKVVHRTEERLVALRTGLK